MHKQSKIRITDAMMFDLEVFTRDELRAYAKKIGVPRGRNKQETISNIYRSGKGKVAMFLIL